MTTSPHSTTTGQCVIGTGGQFGVGINSLRIVSDDQSRFASGLAYLIAYIDGHLNSSPMLIRHATRLLKSSSSNLSAKEESLAADIIKSFLPELTLDDWGRTVSSEESGLLARAIGFFRKNEKTC